MFSIYITQHKNYGFEIRNIFICKFLIYLYTLAYIYSDKRGKKYAYEKAKVCLKADSVSSGWRLSASALCFFNVLFVEMYFCLMDT